MSLAAPPVSIARSSSVQLTQEVQQETCHMLGKLFSDFFVFLVHFNDIMKIHHLEKSVDPTISQ